MKVHAAHLLLAVIVLLSVLLLPGCQRQVKQNQAGSSPTSTGSLLSANTEPENALTITGRYAYSEESPYALFYPNDLGGNYDGLITYSLIKDVTISLDGESYPLEGAIKNGYITVDEIIALARKDAKAGICQESTQTNLGLTSFTYLYEKPFMFELIYTNDVMETADGEKVLVQTLSIAKHEPSKNPMPNDTISKYIEDDRVIHSFSKEDWGLTFTLKEVTEDSIILHYTQTGGQQYGDLMVSGASFGLPDGMEGTFSTDRSFCFDPIPIEMDSSDTLVIPLTFVDSYGKATTEHPAGSYSLRLFVDEEYDPAQMPDLMKNYTDHQIFSAFGTVVLEMP